MAALITFVEMCLTWIINPVNDACHSGWDGNAALMYGTVHQLQCITTYEITSKAGLARTT